jgi:DNA mismatch endonuclease (patch repair protein)
MRANRRISGAEIRFRKALWAEGVRGFRRGDDLPGRPDVVLSRIRLAIFVHGCYWHRCPICNLRLPKANSEFWRTKFEANLARDKAVRHQLAESGWKIVTIWEHELRADVCAAAGRLAAQITALRSQARPASTVGEIVKSLRP